MATVKWRVKEPVRFQSHDPIAGGELTFKAGEHAPKSEQEEHALRELEAMGLAEAVKEKGE